MTVRPSSAPPYTTALVVIARDEERCIGRLLDSMRPWVDQMWVIDTGSVDRTVTLAQAGGATVRHFAWCDDFAAARNHALDQAACDWHIVLDADEWLAEGGEVLAGLRQRPPDRVGALQVNSDYDQAGQVLQAPSWLSRVLPGGVRYQGRVHEQPAHRLPVQRLPVVVGHDGYRQAGLEAKQGRNAGLLALAIAEQPVDPYLHYQLGKDHDVYGRHAQALLCFGAAEQTLGEDAALPGWHLDMTVRQLHALKCVGHYAQALELGQARLGLWPASPDIFFALGDLMLDWAIACPNLAPELIPMMENAWQTCLELGERPDLEGSVAGRGSHLAATNLALLYDSLGRTQDAAACRALSWA